MFAKTFGTKSSQTSTSTLSREEAKLENHLLVNIADKEELERQLMLELDSDVSVRLFFFMAVAKAKRAKGDRLRNQRAKAIRQIFFDSPMMNLVCDEAPAEIMMLAKRGKGLGGLIELQKYVGIELVKHPVISDLIAKRCASFTS